MGVLLQIQVPKSCVGESFVSAPNASFSVVFNNKKITYFNHEALKLLRDERVAPLTGVRSVDCKSVVGTDKYCTC